VSNHGQIIFSSLKFIGFRKWNVHYFILTQLIFVIVLDNIRCRTSDKNEITIVQPHLNLSATYRARSNSYADAMADASGVRDFKQIADGKRLLIVVTETICCIIIECINILRNVYCLLSSIVFWILIFFVK